MGSIADSIADNFMSKKIDNQYQYFYSYRFFLINIITIRRLMFTIRLTDVSFQGISKPRTKSVDCGATKRKVCYRNYAMDEADKRPC